MLMQKKRNKIAYLILILPLILSCTGNTHKSSQTAKLDLEVGDSIKLEIADGIDAFDSERQDVFPAFESIRMSNDTLYLLGNDEYVFFPFGEHKDPCEVPFLSEIGGFEYQAESVSYPVICYVSDSTVLSLQLNVFEDESYFGDYFSVVYSSIEDNSIVLERNIHVGMRYREFLDSFGIKDEYQNVRVVQWDTCLVGGQILFRFDSDGLLISINILSDYVMFEEVKQYLESRG